jgi:hypothetical protein
VSSVIDPNLQPTKVRIFDKNLERNIGDLFRLPGSHLLASPLNSVKELFPEPGLLIEVKA